MNKNEINIGDTFGQLKVLEVLGANYICRCSCGKKVIRTGHRLKLGGSCGHKDDTPMIGKTFGELQIIDFNLHTGKWICKCSCGNITEVETRYLKSGNTKSCGHTKYLSKINSTGKKFKHDLTGLTFGKLKVLKYIDDKGLWECECSCKRIEQFTTYELNSGSRTECKKCRYLTKFGDISGVRFGQLVAIDYNIDTGKWICRCDCGNITEVDRGNLNNGRVSTCGHLKGKPREDLTGKKFNELTAIKYAGNGKYLFKCSCQTEKILDGFKVKNGMIKSCGHLKEIDLSDKVFGELKVIKRDDNEPWKWVCKCSCGKIKSIATGALTTGNYKSCGHLREEKFIDLTNLQFGKLIVTRYLGGQTWECRCSCGNTVSVLGHNLRSGHTQSCGCETLALYRETMLNKYGDVSSSKIQKPREEWQIIAVSSREEFIEYLCNKRKTHSKLTLDIVSKDLGVHRADINYYFNKYNIPMNIYLDSESSKYESELLEIFKQGVQRDRKALGNNQEIDIYFPNKKLGIEFNGNYWHSAENKDYKYHQNKTLIANSRGIRLIHIFEYEWTDLITKNKIISLISEILDSTDKQIIYARNTVVKEINNVTSDSFLNKYHLQNTAKSSVKLGCYYNNELLGVITFGIPRFNKNYEYELIRLCWKSNVYVVGGLEKLFYYFVKRYNPKSVITYVDISKFTGNGYLKVGFNLTDNPITEPSYVWCKGNEVLSRYQTQKHKLIEAGLGTEDQTENEIMITNGYHKIYNSGNLILHWFNKNI